jgi:hypothetical protein
MGIKPALIRFGAEIEAILKRHPAVGPFFPYLCTVRANDRATKFRQRCDGLEISGVSLHSLPSRTLGGGGFGNRQGGLKTSYALMGPGASAEMDATEIKI